MKNKNIFVKIVFVVLIVLLLFSLVAPAIFSQTPLPSPRKENLLNGLKVLMWSDARSDKVTVRIRIHSGSAFDPQGKEGVMQLLADNIFPSEATRDFFTDDLQGSLEVIANYDYIQINASGKPDSLISIIETLSTAVSNPTIDKATTAKLRAALLSKVMEREMDPVAIADQAAAKRLLGSFPYGRPRFGSPTSLQSIDYADLIDAKQRFLTADNATISLSGNFDRTLALRAVRRYFGSWLKADKLTPSTFRQADDPPTGLLTVASPKPGIAALRFALRGTARSDKDMAASLVFTSILESRLKARVPTEHSADLFVRNEVRTLPGIITIGFFVDKSTFGKENGKVDASELVGKTLSDAITEMEFQTAKTTVQSVWTKRDPAMFFLDADTYKIADPNADVAAVDRTSLSDVRAYADKLKTQPIVVVLVNTPPAAKQ